MAADIACTSSGGTRQAASLCGGNISRRPAHVGGHDRHAGGRRLQEHASQRLLPGRVNQERQLVENPRNVVAHAEKMDPSGQRPRGSLMKLVFELPRLLLAGEPLADDQPGKHGRFSASACPLSSQERQAASTSCPLRSEIWPIVPISGTSRASPSCWCR